MRFRAIGPYLLLIVIGLVVISVFFRDFGMTWDEHVQMTYGELVLDYFKSGFQDTRCNDYINLRFYGPPFDLFAAFVYQFSPDQQLPIRHFLNALTGLLAVIGAYAFGRLLPGGRFTAVAAALVLAMLPRFFGHAFNDPKDIPFACGFVWAMYGIARVWLLDRKSWGDIALATVGIGAALAIRPGGMPLFLIFALIILFFRALILKRTPGSASGMDKCKGVLIVAGAWLIMVLFWPWAHANPILHPWKASVEAVAFVELYPVFFEGQEFMSDALPRYYLAKYLFITTPPIFLILGLTGLAVCVYKQLRDWGGKEFSVMFLMEVWLIVPIVMFAVMRPNVYDGMRQFLFLLPAFALFAGMGASAVTEGAGRLIKQPLFIQGLVLALIVVAGVLPLRALHPYQTSYFNALAGGMEKAEQRYEVDYWASSYKEAAAWINEEAARRDGEKPLVVQVAANAYSYHCLANYLNEDIVLASMFDQEVEGAVPKQFDYYVATTRYGLDRNYPDSPAIHTIGRRGAIFSVIKEGPGRQTPPEGNEK